MTSKGEATSSRATENIVSCDVAFAGASGPPLSGSGTFFLKTK